MHSRIVAIVGTVAIALLGSAGAMAQDATLKLPLAERVCSRSSAYPN